MSVDQPLKILDAPPFFIVYETVNIDRWTKFTNVFGCFQTRREAEELIEALSKVWP